MKKSLIPAIPCFFVFVFKVTRAHQMLWRKLIRILQLFCLARSGVESGGWGRVTLRCGLTCRFICWNNYTMQIFMNHCIGCNLIFKTNIAGYCSFLMLWVERGGCGVFWHLSLFKKMCFGVGWGEYCALESGKGCSLGVFYVPRSIVCSQLLLNE